MEKTGTMAPLLSSPLKTTFALLSIQFVSETVVMFILPLVHLNDSDVAKNFADSSLATILSAPFVWALVGGGKLCVKKTGHAAPYATSRMTTIFALLTILFVAESIIMFILPLLHLHDLVVVENFVDSFLLAILCAPFVWALISGRKRAEMELKASEDSLRVIFNSVNDAIIIHDLNGDITDVNDKMLEMFGVSREQAITLSIKDDYSGRDNPLEYIPFLLEKAARGESQFFEWKARRPNDGSLFDVEVFLRNITLDGKDVVLASIRDITKRKWAEDLLRRNRDELTARHEELQDIYLKLEDKSRDLETAYTELKATQAQILHNDKMASIGQLAAGVAHEINNPIGFVNSNLGTLDKYVAKTVEFINAQAEKIASQTPADVVKELTEKRKALKLDYILDDMKNLIRESLDGTSRVQKIVQDLKSFSRVDAAEHALADINACLESTINIVWNEIKYKATLQRDFGDLPQIKCYPQQLNQVFMNLLINAAHAIDENGSITVRSRHEDGLIQVSISDTGCGIPENIRTKIFEPFFTTKEVGKGTGLGLSISYDIAKKHGGEIRLASEVGKGTTFTVVVPVTAA